MRRGAAAEGGGPEEKPIMEMRTGKTTLAVSGDGNALASSNVVCVSGVCACSWSSLRMDCVRQFWQGLLFPGALLDVGCSPGKFMCGCNGQGDDICLASRGAVISTLASEQTNVSVNTGASIKLMARHLMAFIVSQFGARRSRRPYIPRRNAHRRSYPPTLTRIVMIAVWLVRNSVLPLAPPKLRLVMRSGVRMVPRCLPSGVMIHTPPGPES